MIKYLITFFLIASPCLAGIGIGGFPQPGPGVVAEASGGASYTDDFNRANESPLTSPWGQIGTYDLPKIVSNSVYSSSFGFNAAYYNQTIDANQYVQVKLLSTNNDQGVLLRVDNSRSNEAKIGYQIFINDGSLYIRKWHDGGFTNLVSVVQSVSVNDILKASISGSTIKAYVNGTEKLSTTDTTYGSGYVGISPKDQYSPAMDDFAGGNL